MEERAYTSGLLPIQRGLPEPKPRHSGTSQRQIDKAREVAESIARIAPTVEATFHYADDQFAAGIISCQLDDAQTGLFNLTNALVGMMFGIWQLDRLSSESIAHRDFSTAGPRKARAERQLQFIPGRMQLASTSLRRCTNGDAAFAEFNSTVTAFVAGSNLVQHLLSDSAAASWNRAFTTACESSPDPMSETSVAGLGVPDLSLHPLPSELNRPGGRTGCPGLSAREREVLTQIVGGLTTSEIAYRLGVKTTTVATLVGRIFNKLGVNNRPSAVAAALRYGLCTHDD